jgi:anti-sigma regulatory factor (Ser/Thr protein kinase)
MATNLNSISPPDARLLPVADTLDCAAAQQSAREMAALLGFAESHVEEIVIAVSELAANLVRHAGGGVITLKPLYAAGCTGIGVESDDNGPGIADINRSVADGYSTGGGLGYGLGAVNRLMDEMDISSRQGVGTRIVCQRWLRPPAGLPCPARWDVAAASRSRRLAPENGDTFVIHKWQGKLLAGLIDGLGHGEFAQQAANAAQQYIRNHYDLPLEKIFAGVGRACRGTRGVVMALARFDSPTRLMFASVGNVEARVCGPRRTLLMVQRGTLGLDERYTVVQEDIWDPASVLVLHSDGLSERWQCSDFPGLVQEPAGTIVRKLINNLEARDDDATVLVVRGVRQ